MKKVIAIDLGSTNSAVCVIEQGKPLAVTNEEGSRTTPSIINLMDNNPKVGGAAKRQLLVHPKETVVLIKRFMGGTYEEVKDAIKHVQYEVVDDEGLPRIVINGRKYAPEELSAMIVQKMKKIAEDYLGDKVTDAVITVPAFFGDSAKKATKLAGEMAGLKVLRIISEPTAAVLASSIDKEKGGKYLVVDFGGSTTDFSVADISDNVIEILASYGDVYLGGSDIDKIISDYLVENFKKDNDGLDISLDPMAMARVIEAAENAKMELSNTLTSEINLPYIAAKDGVPIHLNETLTRAKFETLIQPIVDRVINCGKIAVEKSGIAISELDGVLLVGGSCRIPMVQSELVKVFGDKLLKNANLDLSVAEGAAIQANILANGVGDILLLDVTPLTLGIETLGGVMTPLVEANTTIPVRRSQIFSTAEDNQPQVDINVLQGERPMAKDNKSIGLFKLDGIAPARRGVPKIEVTFEIDANGIVTVSAIDKATNKENHITIESKGSLSQEEIDRIKAEAKAHEYEDKKTKEKLEKSNKCEGLIYSTEQSLESLQEHVTDDDKAFFEAKLATLKDMKEHEDYVGFDDVEKEIQERWHTISAKAYGGQNGGNGFDYSSMFGGQPNGFNFNGGAPQNNNGAQTGQEDVEVQDAK